MKFIGIVAALIFIGFGVWLGWIFVTNINAADASIKAGLIGLFGTLFIALIAQHQSKKREIAERHFSDKRSGYMHMIDLLIELISSAKKKEELTESDLLEKIIPFKKSLLIWGGADLIDAWNQFELRSVSELSPENMILELDKILRAIRKDLGHDDAGLKPGSLWGLFLIPEDKNKILK